MAGTEISSGLQSHLLSLEAAFVAVAAAVEAVVAVVSLFLPSFVVNSNISVPIQLFFAEMENLRITLVVVVVVVEAEQSCH